MLDKQLPGLEDIGGDNGRSAEVETEVPREALHIPVEALGLTPPVLVTPQTSVRQAATLMVQMGVGSALVMEEGRLVGIITERDIVARIPTSEACDKSIAVRDVMTPNPRTLNTKAMAVDAMAVMSDEGYRRIPVINETGDPCGVVSARQIIDRLVGYFPEEIMNLPPRPIRCMVSREGA